MSGAQQGAAATPLLDALGKTCGLELDTPPLASDRNAPNSRWLVSYTKGMMDTDRLSDFVYGELYVPVQVVGGEPRFTRSWSFPATMEASVRDYALDFAKPFWAAFEVHGDVRTTQISFDPGDPDKKVTLTETLREQSETGYSYTVAQLAGVSQTGAFSLHTEGDHTALQWTCEFTADTSVDLVRWLAMLAQTATTMESRLAGQFAPK